MIKIYIIEDESAPYTSLFNELDTAFGNAQVKVLPTTQQPATNRFLNWSVTKKYIRNEVKKDPINQEWIAQFYSELITERIDYFIVDNCLLHGDEDNTGISIIRFLSSKGFSKDKLILFTKDGSPGEEEEDLDSICTILTKHTHKNIGVIEHIKNVSNLNYLHPKKIRRRVFRAILGEKIVDGIAVALQILTISALIFGIVLTVMASITLFKDDSRLREKEGFNTELKLSTFEKKENLDSNSISPLSNSNKEIEDSSTVSKIDVDSANLNSTKNVGITEIDKHSRIAKLNAMKLLQFIEGLFLNFLPFFIIFGFLGYYNNYLRFIWSTANANKLKPKLSMQSLKFSKSLFISSIIATLIINILEILVDPASISGENYLVKLIPHFLLIVVLCIYFFALERTESGETN